MKKLLVFCLAAVLMLCPCSVSAAETEEDVSITSGCNTLNGNITYLGSQPLFDSCASVILYEATTDTLMYAYNADDQLQPASLVKIMTALIAIEKGNLSDKVTVKADVLDTIPVDAMIVGLYRDEVLTVEDLLHCMMVASGNDAAAVLADYIMGSQEAFVAEMNRFAAELGCTNTNFTNVHGLSDRDQYASVRDMARILSYAIQNETFKEVYGALYYTVPETNKFVARFLTNENYLLNTENVVGHYDPRVTGSRTGIAEDRTRCISATAEQNGMVYISVIMGAESIYEDDGYSTKYYGGYAEHKKLLDLGMEGYKSAQVLFENQVLLQKPVLNGDSDIFIGPHTSADSVIPSSMLSQDLSYHYLNEVTLIAPIEKGQKLSTVQIWCGSVCIAQADLFAMNSVKEASQLSVNNQTAGGNGFWKVLLYVLGAVFGIVGVIFIPLVLLRTIRITKVKNQRRRNRRYRRRSR